MAALNKNETQVLRLTIALLANIKRDGYDPKSKDHEAKGKAIDEASRGVHTVVQMKGYSPK